MQRSLADCIKRYGQINEAGLWIEEPLWCRTFVTSPLVSRELLNTGTRLPAKHIYCNVDMILPLQRAFDNVIARGRVSELQTYDGCLEIRNVRGALGAVPSVHSYALAIDLNAVLNPLNTDGRWTADFVRCFTDEGFTWGGNFRTRKDPMHFSYGWE